GLERPERAALAPPDVDGKRHGPDPAPRHPDPQPLRAAHRHARVDGRRLTALRRRDRTADRRPGRSRPGRPAPRGYDLRVSAPVVVILAAGQGVRMRSATPKLLHPLCGRPMIAWPVAAAREAGAGKVVVVDSRERPLGARLDGEVAFAIQEHPRGTADAVKAASAHIDPNAPAIVLQRE